MGAKVVQGHFSIRASDVTLRTEDIELNTINALFIQQDSIGTFIIASMVAPGTYNNYASLAGYNIGTGMVPIQVTGTREGSALSAHFLAIGE